MNKKKMEQSNNVMDYVYVGEKQSTQYFLFSGKLFFLFLNRLIFSKERKDLHFRICGNNPSGIPQNQDPYLHYVWG